MSGPIPPSQRHVVIVEIYGKKTKAEYEEFRKALEKLVKTYGGKIVLRARGKRRQ